MGVDGDSCITVGSKLIVGYSVVGAIEGEATLGDDVGVDKVVGTTSGDLVVVKNGLVVGSCV
jgi:hypothetical protein